MQLILMSGRFTMSTVLRISVWILKTTSIVLTGDSYLFLMAGDNMRANYRRRTLCECDRSVLVLYTFVWGQELQRTSANKAHCTYWIK